MCACACACCVGWARAERAREEVTQEYLRQRQAKRAAEDAALSKETAASS